MKNTMTKETAELPGDLREKKQLGKGETFCFGCHRELSCFTRCCADVNIMLTPVDVLRLSRRLNMTTTDFLEEHTFTPFTKELQLPVVMLKMGDEPDKKCHFVGDEGCTVYEDRPWSCRMYPIGMAIPPARAGVEPEPVHFLFEDDFCEGRTEKKEWTVEQWKQSEGVPVQEELEKGFREIVSHPWFIGGKRQLDPRRMEMFYTGCYDLDSFRRFVAESSFTKRFELDDELVEQIKSDDEALLRFAFRWLRFALFAEPTVTVKESAAEAGRNP
jgi:Fe-S-cluster containining protein